jgi:hypothetical protein
VSARGCLGRTQRVSEANDFGVTRNSSSNADAMVLGSARLRGIHPLILFKMADIQGGKPLKRALARTMASAFDDESWRGSGYSSQPSVCLILCPGLEFQRMQMSELAHKSKESLFRSQQF